MKKSQFVAIVIMFVVASVLICVGAFSKDFVKDGGEAEPTDSLLTATDVPTDNGGTDAPTATDVPTEEPSQPATEIKNENYAGVDNTVLYWSYTWVDVDNQARPVIGNDDIKSAIKDIEYIFINNTSAEWDMYLTFTMHMESGMTTKILDTLADRGDKASVKATFFMTADYIKENPEIVKRIHDEGHQIGTRGPSPEISDDALQNMTAEEWAAAFKEVEEEYKKAIGDDNAKLELCRLDRFSTMSLKVATDMGYKIVFKTYTSMASRDGEPDWHNKGYDATQMVDRLWQRGTYDGSVMELTISETIASVLDKFLDTVEGDDTLKFKLL